MILLPILLWLISHNRYPVPSYFSIKWMISILLYLENLNIRMWILSRVIKYIFFLNLKIVLHYTVKLYSAEKKLSPRHTVILNDVQWWQKVTRHRLPIFASHNWLKLYGIWIIGITSIIKLYAHVIVWNGHVITLLL